MAVRTEQQFTRDDGRVIPIIPGFRKQVLAAPRVSVQPKPEWTETDYQAAADKKVRHLQDFIDEFIGHGGVLEGANVIELGCGAGIDCLLIALGAVRSVVGIDLELPLFDPGDKGERTRRLTRDVLALVGESTDIDAVLARLPLRFATTDAKQMAFPDNSFDLLWSRAAMEHIVPPEDALAEMARVVRPGGLIYHAIDPFYWLKGCHKRGVTDIPWAHARLAPTEYYRFLAETEGESTAKKSARHLQTLNQLTPRQWRATLSEQFEILQWTEDRWPIAETLLEQHPDVRDTLLAGVEPGDLTCRSIKVWMRN